MQEKPKHQVGDHVQRLSDVFDSSSQVLYGIVAKGPYSKMNSHGWYPELYDVLWRQRPKIERGFFRYGIKNLTHD